MAKTPQIVPPAIQLQSYDVNHNIKRDNLISRRVLLKRVSMAAGVTLAAPIVTSFSLITSNGSRLFVAEANPGAGLLVLRILGAAASIVTILEWLNIRPT